MIDRAGPGPPDRPGARPLLALYSGDVLTMDPGGSRPTAVLALGDRIVACGGDAEITGLFAELRGLRGVARDARAIDLGGRAVVPGLIDSHLHLLWYGFFLQQVDLNGVTSIADMLERVRARALRTPPGNWISGAGWQQDFMAEKRMPNRRDLDPALPDHPVVLHRVCYHSAVCNSAALAAAGISRETPDPPGGLIGRDPSGEPDGLLYEGAVSLVTGALPRPSANQSMEALRLACRRASAAGLTSVHSNDGGEESLPAYVALRDAGELTVRVYCDIGFPEDERGLGLPGGLGDDWVKVGGVKLFADGSLGARTAALRSPYSDAPDTSGFLIHSPERLAEMILKTHRHGRQAAVHAIGDRAVEAALDGIEAALGDSPREDPRHRIIHAQVLAPDLIARMARLGVIVDIQPKFTTGELSWAPERVGPEREPYSYCWRTLLTSGVRCAGGSDCPVEPLEPLWGIYAAVTRSSMPGSPEGGWLPGERLDPLTALKLFTVDAAYAAFEETRKGSIEPGKLADLVVLDRAPDRVPGHGIKDLRVEMTVVGGKVVFEEGAC